MYRKKLNIQFREGHNVPLSILVRSYGGVITEEQVREAKERVRNDFDVVVDELGQEIILNIIYTPTTSININRYLLKQLDQLENKHIVDNRNKTKAPKEKELRNTNIKKNLFFKSSKLFYNIDNYPMIYERINTVEFKRLAGCLGLEYRKYGKNEKIEILEALAVRNDELGREIERFRCEFELSILKCGVTLKVMKESDNPIELLIVKEGGLFENKN